MLWIENLKLHLSIKMTREKWRRRSARPEEIPRRNFSGGCRELQEAGWYRGEVDDDDKRKESRIVKEDRAAAQKRELGRVYAIRHIRIITATGMSVRCVACFVRTHLVTCITFTRFNNSSRGSRVFSSMEKVPRPFPPFLFFSFLWKGERAASGKRRSVFEK